MLLIRSFVRRTRSQVGLPLKASAIAAAVLAGGCSADVARFDSPSFALNGGSTGALPSESMRRAGGSGLPGPDGGVAAPADGAYVPPRPGRGVEVAALPEAHQPPSPAPLPSHKPESRRPVMAPTNTTPPAAAGPHPIKAGEQIEVQHGDTLYGLSKRHHVSVAELMTVNGLQNPNLKPGQKLTLPAGKSARKPLMRKPIETAAAALPRAGWDGSYTVKPGDSLYAVARHHKVKLEELQQVNGIADVRKVKPGAVLKVPGGGAVAAAPAPVAPPVAPVTASEAPSDPAPRVVQTRPTILNGEKKVAALGNDTPVEAAAPAPAPVEKVAAATPPPVAAVAAGSGKLRWPARGKIIAGFGQRPDGTHNDGVNFAVPLGTEVHAADAGVVAYAGSELKGYGNLVLVRHDNGWVTAYAHNDEIIVKRGDKIKRGQLLAKAGKSGQVDQPQVHFELRQGSKPVDPTPFMEKL
jgi:murein DD-endopeptidase MepM/ murein hydrolase activator NlpD